MSEHIHHAENSSGSQCTACQMSLIEQTIKATTSRPHTFRFISPLETGQSGIPNPCTSCHAGKSNDWAIQPLRRGREFRLGELRIEPHGRLNRDRSGMSKPSQAISADLRLPLVRQLDRGDARRTPARDRSVAIKYHFVSGIFSKTSAAISDRERCLRR